MTVATESKRVSRASRVTSTDTQGQKRQALAPENSNDPIDIKKWRIFRDYGYIQNKRGLYIVTQGREDEEKLTLIERMHVDVSSTRHVFTVPDNLADPPKAQGVVHVTQFSALPGLALGDDDPPTQTVEIYSSDMTARQPKFFEELQAVVRPHFRRRPDLIRAIDVLGTLAPKERRYSATGLIQTEKNGLAFLHPSGPALTARGTSEQYQVQFSFHVAKGLTTLAYGWTGGAARGGQAKKDFHTLLQMSDIAPQSPGYGDVLMGLAGFAPMSQLCETGGLWAVVHGTTGSFKSASSRLPLQGYAHNVYGRAETSTINLREGVSTDFAIEQALHALGGMFAHLDDGLRRKNVTDKDVKKFYKMLSTIGSHAVSKQGGKRGQWNQGEGGFGISPYPRGSGVFTVEVLPDTEERASELARFLVVSLERGQVDIDLLTQLQSKESAAAMNRATCAFIQWLLPHMQAMLDTLPAREERYREQGVHSRTPTHYAKAELGIDAFLQYGVSIGALSEEEAAAKLEAARARLVQVALTQKSLMGGDGPSSEESDTVTIFYELLREALRTKKLYACDSEYRAAMEYGSDGNATKIAGYRPQPPVFLNSEDTQDIINDLPDLWGWKWNEQQRLYESPGIEGGVLKLDGASIKLYMYVKDFKEIVYRELDKLAKSHDTPLPGLHGLTSRLKEKGKLTTTNPTNLHGRGSRTDRCYILDLTPETGPGDDEPEKEDAAEIEGLAARIGAETGGQAAEIEEEGKSVQQWFTDFQARGQGYKLRVREDGNIGIGVPDELPDEEYSQIAEYVELHTEEIKTLLSQGKAVPQGDDPRPGDGDDNSLPELDD